jgi:hypothetical protein
VPGHRSSDPQPDRILDAAQLDETHRPGPHSETRVVHSGTGARSAFPRQRKSHMEGTSQPKGPQHDPPAGRPGENLTWAPVSPIAGG